MKTIQSFEVLQFNSRFFLVIKNKEENGRTFSRMYEVDSLEAATKMINDVTCSDE